MITRSSLEGEVDYAEFCIENDEFYILKMMDFVFKPMDLEFKMQVRSATC